MTAPDRIREWVNREFSYKVDEIVQELLDAATGNRTAPLKPFHRKALAAIFPEWTVAG
jgi:hypothetical protein